MDIILIFISPFPKVHFCIKKYDSTPTKLPYSACCASYEAYEGYPSWLRTKQKKDELYESDNRFMVQFRHTFSIQKFTCGCGAAKMKMKVIDRVKRVLCRHNKEG